MLYGREHERAGIERLLAEARQGRSGVLVLRGEPGIGKTALLDHAAGAAEGFRVIRAGGVEYEAELPFAGLHLLLGPALDRLPVLPGPQRRALERAFGLVEPDAGATAGAAPADRLLAGLAVLTLLSELADEQPLLCLVDDAQWLDRESSAALLLAARRLQAEGVVLLLAAREGEGHWSAPGLPELRLGALGAAAAGELLAARAAGAGAALDRESRNRVLAEAHGNPLALLELPGERPGAPGPADPGEVPLAGRLQLAYHGQVSRMPAATQTLLLVAAAEETGDLAVVLRAAALLGAAPEDLRPAEDTGLVRLEDSRRLAFRHPLLRSAVHRRAPLAQRLAAHRALAEALAGDGPDDGDRAGRQAWHRALAATGPDEAVAAALERAAERATRRGGHAGAASAYERAARLSPDPDEATRRATWAAEAASEAGELDLAAGLAERTLRRDPTDPLTLAQLLLVQGADRFWRGSHGSALELLLRSAELVAEMAPGHAARVLNLAFHAAWYQGEPAAAEVLDRLAGLRLPAGDPAAPLIGYLLGAAGPLLGRDPGAAPTLAEAVAGARRAGPIAPVDLLTTCGAALIPGHDEETGRLAAELVAEARVAGALGVLPTLLFFLAESELFQGSRADALAHGEEALRIAEDTGQLQWTGQMHGFLGYLAAMAGDGPGVRAAVGRSLAAGVAGRPWTQWALGLLDLGQGRAGECLARLEPLVGGVLRFHVSALRAVPDLVEAAVRLREPERAAEAFGYFRRWAERAERPWAAALVLRCEALLGEESEAEARYLAALRLHTEQERPWERARTELLYGEWLRRARRKAEARGPLRAALWAFEELDAAPWAERARAELAASGDAAPEDRARSPLAGLTPQETQIVRLAARGLSNRDIAAQLFLSSRTVGYHLYKAYPKLGVGSRGELVGLL
ncbi:AAA family ATPase [Streptacidiphilus sp. P02-A3a]|uniref:ATP-binding protein n=1 Tax=Streptacidiphilus sp. P02-A3a TaxID=2704468 RepID=UPI0015F94868|nr:LuxR family transcriptional regulator [Streptacidiphilus sp. P02-A3a]QMU69231.1 AAA family ATPase [Streptacidiphilus sp. P02-A3a]